MYCLIGQIKNQVKFIIISTQHILQCNQSDSLADASGRIVDLMNENARDPAQQLTHVTQVWFKSYNFIYLIFIYLIFISYNFSQIQCLVTIYIADTGPTWISLK